jgi:hypothetical protein
MNSLDTSHLFRTFATKTSQQIGLCVAALALATPDGCEGQSTIIVPSDSLIIRVLAPSNGSEAFLNAAFESEGAIVSIEGEVVAQWIPFREDLAQAYGNLDELVVRRSQRGSELLVLHTDDDVTGHAVRSIASIFDQASNEKTLVTLTEEGSANMFAFTVQNVGKRTALIVNDELRAVSLIASPVRTRMVITPEEIDKVRTENIR